MYLIMFVLTYYDAVLKLRVHSVTYLSCMVCQLSVELVHSLRLNFESDKQAGFLHVHSQNVHVGAANIGGSKTKPHLLN